MKDDRLALTSEHVNLSDAGSRAIERMSINASNADGSIVGYEIFEDYIVLTEDGVLSTTEDSFKREMDSKFVSDEKKAKLKADFDEDKDGFEAQFNQKMEDLKIQIEDSL